MRPHPKVGLTTLITEEKHRSISCIVVGIGDGRDEMAQEQSGPQQTAPREPVQRVILTLAHVSSARDKEVASAAELDLYLRRKVDPEETDISTLTDELWSAFQEGQAQAGARATVAAVWMLEQDVRHLRKHGLSLLRGLSGSNCAEAQFHLALEMLRGGAIDRDLKGAKALCEAVCKSTDEIPSVRGKALVKLGDLLRDGRGCEKDPIRALELYEQAAALNNGTGAHRAALFHHGLVEGWDGDRDLNRAAHFYEIAAVCGEVKAQTALGLLHGSGALKQSDSVYGLKLLKRAMEGGEGVATAVLSTMQRESSSGGSSVGARSRGQTA